MSGLLMRRRLWAGLLARRLMAIRRLLLLGLALLLASGCWLAAQAANTATTGQPTWQQLTPMQQAALGPLQAEWPHFDADRKRKWLNIAARYSAMSPEQRTTLHQRMVEWVHMSPQQRRQARENFLATGKAPLDSRKQAWERYKKLPEAEKRALAREAKRPPHTPGHVGRYEAEQRLKKTKTVSRTVGNPPRPASTPAAVSVAPPTPAPTTASKPMAPQPPPPSPKP
ncbi:MAG: DUF3106 domain-containing protein [Thiomonas sp.]|uniref:Transmembrane protein n=1 Tax=mine drainage metagenome TaxID=410659 RepID=E6PSZ6_9ZZZZ